MSTVGNTGFIAVRNVDGTLVQNFDAEADGIVSAASVPVTGGIVLGGEAIPDAILNVSSEYVLNTSGQNILTQNIAATGTVSASLVDVGGGTVNATASAGGTVVNTSSQAVLNTSGENIVPSGATGATGTVSAGLVDIVGATVTGSGAPITSAGAFRGLLALTGNAGVAANDAIGQVLTGTVPVTSGSTVFASAQTGAAVVIAATSVPVVGGLVEGGDGTFVEPVIVTEDDETLIYGGSFGVAAMFSTSDTAIAASQTGSGPRAGDARDAVGTGATIITSIYRANRDNTWLEDISDRVEGGSIVVDTTRAVPMTFQAQTTEPGVLTPYRDWVAPVMTYRYPDPDSSAWISVTQQLGLYIVMPPTKTYSAAQGVETIDGRDPLWLMASTGPGEPWSRATGQNVGIAIETVCNLAGIRHAIQTTSQTLPKRRTWPWNASWLDIANDLARSIGFVPLWIDRVGRARSHRFRKLSTVEPARVISSGQANVIDSVRIEPDMARLCNHVVVVGNDPKGNPVIAERLNNDPDSPTSTVSLGTAADPVRISRFEEDPNIDDQDAADQLADRIMDQSTSVFQRVNVTTLPVLDWEIGDTASLDIETDNGDEVASGLHRWERLSMGLGVDATVNWTFLKLVRWSQVA
jgi:hypothetical protein